MPWRSIESYCILSLARLNSACIKWHRYVAVVYDSTLSPAKSDLPQAVHIQSLILMPLQQKHYISHAVVSLFTYAGQLIHLGLCGNSISTNHDIFIVEKTPPRLYKLR